MTKNIIYILVAGVAVYFLFFYKKDKETTATTPTTPTGGGTSGGRGGGSTPTGTTAPPYAIGETRLKLKTGCSSYYVDTGNKDYTNTDLAPVFLGGKVVRRGTQQGVNGYILQFNTANGIKERAFYESDLII